MKAVDSSQFQLGFLINAAHNFFLRERTSFGGATNLQLVQESTLDTKFPSCKTHPDEPFHNIGASKSVARRS